MVMKMITITITITIIVTITYENQTCNLFDNNPY
jgi:hypothetical protein